jgi:hypothetical protein
MLRALAFSRIQATASPGIVPRAAMCLAVAVLTVASADVALAQQSSNGRDSKSGDQRSSGWQAGGGQFERPSYGEFSRPSFEPRRAVETYPLPGRPPLVVSRPPLVVSPASGVVLYNTRGIGYSSGSYTQPAWIYYLPGGTSYMIATSAGLMGPYSLLPVDAQFGPGAVQQFMGVQPGGIQPGIAPPQIAPQQIAPQQIAPQQMAPGGMAGQQNAAVGAPQQGAPQQGAAAAGPFQPEPPAKPNVRPSNAAARERAWRQIELGDAEFLQRQFARALDHYRNASAAAADLGEAFFRQGQGMIALGLYDPAAKAMRRGLLFDPDWADSDFHLDDLYGDNKPVKEGKLDTLEKAAAAHPQDPELQFLAGIELFFDGQLDRAAPFLRRADAMYGPQASLLQGFLKKLPVAKAPAQKPGANVPPQKKPAAADDGVDA